MRVSWRQTFLGALLGALLFSLGRTLLGLYLLHGLVGSLYGAAGSLIVFLLWAYSSALVFYLAVITTKVVVSAGTSVVEQENHSLLGTFLL